EEKNTKAETATVTKKKKGSVAKKIAEKEEQKKKEAAAKKAKRKRIYQEQLKSDLENAESMFRGVSIKGSSLDKINPRTRDEFDEFSKLLCERIKKHEKQALYVTFINGFVKELCSNLKDVEIRKLSSILSTLANEKTRATKEKGKKKNKPKPTLHAELDETADFGNYNDEYDDDFM
ncbi:9622_t:CDS:2, partial [Entrophospora sp. SA101]